MESLFPNRRSPNLQRAIDLMSEAGETERGAVYTKPEVVGAILDLSGYIATAPLHERRFLEPSFGGGDFLMPAVDRLLHAFERHGGSPANARALSDAIRAVEVYRPAYDATRSAVIVRLLAWGAPQETASALVDGWLILDDFLLADVGADFDFVVGNPPYVRQERIPEELLSAYRARYKTVYDRADLYVPFYERGLQLLSDGGRLAYICANRWLKNKYGGPLRAYASSNFHLRFFVDMEGTPAFLSEVIAYPAITVFERGQGETTRVARKPEISEASLSALTQAMLGDGAAADPRVDEIPHAVRGADPWLLDEPERLKLLRRLEASFPDLEAAGCKVGIGVASGADKVYIGKYADLPVEAERKLPMVMAPDLDGAHIHWGGHGVINPFNPDGSLASLDDYPLFGAYMRAHQATLSRRHCAKKSATGWYRTIDRIWDDLSRRPKLLIPDIKGEPTVVLDEGSYYPHHNLYYIASDEWELPALATVLRSSLAVLFVSSYCVRMAGGFLRFQAQYLRRIRVPRWENLSERQRAALRSAHVTLDIDVIDNAVAQAFGLSDTEKAVARAASDEARTPRKTVVRTDSAASATQKSPRGFGA